MNIKQALRIQNTPRLAFVGAGGKTTALFSLARLLPAPVLVTTTTHLASWQLQFADNVFLADQPDDLTPFDDRKDHGVSLFISSKSNNNRHQGLNNETMMKLCSLADSRGLPLLIEADGSRQRPLKAPASHEPSIPDFVDIVVVVSGLSALGKPLTDEWVHRSRIFGNLTGLELNQEITTHAVVRELMNSDGGMKNVPAGARLIALLNQADINHLRMEASTMAINLLTTYQSVIVASMKNRITSKWQKNPLSESQSVEQNHIAPKETLFFSTQNMEDDVSSVYEPVAGIVLAAGESKRYGKPKQLLLWSGIPFINHVAQTALTAGLAPVVVVTGAHRDEIHASLEGLPITIVNNPGWRNGQSTSVKAGLSALPPECGAALFLLSDQPAISVPLISSLLKSHSKTLSPITAPIVRGRQTNPVLFDRVTFPNLMTIEGDQGGRSIFNQYPVGFVSWDDANLLIDVDTPQDYQHLLSQEERKR